MFNYAAFDSYSASPPVIYSVLASLVLYVTKNEYCTAALECEAMKYESSSACEYKIAIKYSFQAPNFKYEIRTSHWKSRNSLFSPHQHPNKQTVEICCWKSRGWKWKEKSRWQEALTRAFNAMCCCCMTSSLSMKNDSILIVFPSHRAKNISRYRAIRSFNDLVWFHISSSSSSATSMNA